MVEKKSTALWQRAISLNRAWLEFATPTQRAAYDSWATAAASRATPIDPDSGFALKALAVVAAVGTAFSEKAKMEADLRDELVRRIARGEFEVLGYRIEPTRSRGPLIIPGGDLKNFPPDWREGSLSVRDEYYLDLRVSPAELRQGAKRGRKGSSDVILAAIDELRATPTLNFCKLPRKQSRQLVLDLLRSKGVEIDQKGNGLSPQNISKLILQRCPKRRIKLSENK